MSYRNSENPSAHLYMGRQQYNLIRFSARIAIAVWLIRRVLQTNANNGRHVDLVDRHNACIFEPCESLPANYARKQVCMERIPNRSHHALNISKGPARSYCRDHHWIRAHAHIHLGSRNYFYFLHRYSHRLSNRLCRQYSISWPGCDSYIQ